MGKQGGQGKLKVVNNEIFVNISIKVSQEFLFTLVNLNTRHVNYDLFSAFGIFLSLTCTCPVM